MNIAIIYKSKYGSTKQYAKWIQHELGAQIFLADQIDETIIRKFDCIIFGSYVHASHITISDILKTYWPIIKKKKVILFSTSAEPANSEYMQDVYEFSLPEWVRSKIAFFPLEGRLIMNELDFMDKAILQTVKSKNLNYNKMEQAQITKLVSFVKEMK